MAIYSLSASTIGRSTHAAGTAGAHLAYIGRPGAAETVIGARMPVDVVEARAWIDAAEPQLRSNGRVLSKFTLALPAELTDPADRMALVRRFAETASAGAAPWLAAVHRPSRGGDERNWHAHLAIHDRHPGTGKTVAGLSNKGTLERLRAVWRDQVNEALERAGAEVRVDHRSLASQGIEAARPVHAGPAVTALERRRSPTRVGDLSRAATSLDRARTAVVTAREELDQLDAELRIAQAREATRKAQTEATALDRELQIAISAAAAAEARRLESVRAEAAAAELRRNETVRLEAAAAEARRLETFRAEAAVAETRRLETVATKAAAEASKTHEIAPSKPESHISVWTPNELPNAGKLVAAYFVYMTKDRTTGTKAGTLFVKARAALGPETVAKLMAWATEKFQSAKAGNADAARSLAVVTESWTKHLKDAAGNFDPSKVKAAIAAFQGGPGESGGPPAGETIRPKRVITKVRPVPGRER